ncbi:MAG: NifU family protein [Firmicutes bacterium]|nr:NifU family protein [Bacillota bacterium]
MAAEMEMKDQIKEAVDDIRPYLQSHNGDVEFVSFEDGIVNVRLQGACHGCAGATMTLKNGIQRILQEQFGEDNVKSVEAV